MVSPVIIRETTGDQYLHELRSAYAGMRLWDPDFALAKDPAIYEKMLRDPVIRSGYDHRRRTVAGGTWHVEPAHDPTEEEEEAARIVEACLREIRGFQAARIRLAGAILQSQRFAYIEGQHMARPYGPDRAMRDWWVPRRLKDVDKRRVRRARDFAEVDPMAHRYELGPVGILHHDYGASGGGGIWTPIDMADFVVVTYEDEEGRLGYGRGLAESLYFYFYGKVKVIEEGLAAAERWAQGLIVAKVSDTSVGDTTQTTAAIRNEIISVIEKSKARHVVAVGKDDDVDVFEPKGTGHRVIMELIEMFDSGITRLLTGALLPSGGGADKGSMARAEVEQEEAESIAQPDSAVLDEAITDGVVAQIWRLNWSHFVDLGLGDARMPRFLSANEKKEDHEKNARIVDTMLGAGVDLVREEVYEKTGFRTPGPEDEVVPGRAEQGGGFPPEGGEGGIAPISTVFSRRRPVRFQGGQERCPDGTFKPKDKACPSHAPLVEDREERRKKAIGDSQDFEREPASSDYRQNYEAWMEDLSEDEEDAIAGWTSVELMRYTAVRSYQVGEYEQEDEELDLSEEDMETFVETLTRSLERAPKVEGEMFRGLSLSPVEAEQLQVGFTFQAKTHASWSSDRAEAEEFTYGGGGDKVAVLLRVEDGMGVDIRELSEAPNEKEVVALAGEGYEIIDIEDEDRLRVVSMRRVAA